MEWTREGRYFRAGGSGGSFGLMGANDFADPLAAVEILRLAPLINLTEELLR